MLEDIYHVDHSLTEVTVVSYKEPINGRMPSEEMACEQVTLRVPVRDILSVFEGWTREKIYLTDYARRVQSFFAEQYKVNLSLSQAEEMEGVLQIAYNDRRKKQRDALSQTLE